MTGEYPRAIPRTAWLTARARNAVQRPVFIGAVGIGAFVAALVALVLAPQQVRRVAQPVVLPANVRPDTAPLIAALGHARMRLGIADSSLAHARARAFTTPLAPTDLPDPRIIARRDSLSTAVNDIDALLTRVETAPNPASYRALAESPQLAANARVKALVDSLAEVERDRERFGAAGGTDSVFVALTSRANEIGHAIQSVARARRDTLREQLGKLSAPAVQLVAAEPAADTLAWIVERDSARSLVTQALSALDDARQKTAEYDREVARAKADARLDAPPVALLAAALVIGIALGFGSAFIGEMRHPRVGDEHELERATGTRVLATVRPRQRIPERGRRSADRAAPPYFDPGADGYQLTYLHVARAGASRLMLTISGDEPGVSAVVGANVAAIAAEEARSTIIVDTDARTAPVSAVLRSRAEPGVVDILDQRAQWSEATSQATVGRDRSIDVIPSGFSRDIPAAARVTDLFRREAARLARHYEAIVIVAPLEHVAGGLPGALPIPDTILCARVGYTRIADVQAALDGVRAAGGTAVGMVLWDAPLPVLPTPDRIARAKRPLNTPVMQALTPSR